MLIFLIFSFEYEMSKVPKISGTAALQSTFFLCLFFLLIYLSSHAYIWKKQQPLIHEAAALAGLLWDSFSCLME